MFINGGPPMMGPMYGGYDNRAPADSGSARQRSTSEKRKALRQAREQQKALARDRAAQAKAKAKPPVAKHDALGAKHEPKANLKAEPKADANAQPPAGQPF